MVVLVRVGVRSEGSTQDVVPEKSEIRLLGLRCPRTFRRRETGSEFLYSPAERV